MSTIDNHGISLYYELHGDRDNPPVLLLSGLAGVGASWSSQISRFAARYFVIVPDQRGTGRSSRTDVGHSTEQLAADMACLVDHLGVGPTHVVGASTGGAIAQYMALNHPRTVATLTLVASFARFDAYLRRQFAARRKMAAEWGREALLSAYSVFLFSPTFARDNPEKVSAWIKGAAALPMQPRDTEIALRRIDMIAAHDTLDRLGHITQPTLAICGEHDFCTPLPLSQEIAAAIPDAKLVIPACGHFVEHELETQFFDLVSGFIEQLRKPATNTNSG
ncbi:alpha/beta fold hydrolase [Mycolicibacterium brisbanense]|uniref:Putative hydrolase, alpha/beta hydrolase fold family n=1 Tax=Mycolicibacterium brisbanense TaxID=146020 RepID=A0A100W0R6_9MYCO|nr:alpha/beta hydrolase [Mycolicibacterium brisbanense]MCV7155906.1 alpha/beta fold hydrolase [Mycolicibacterium brisbanense]GAS89519.1 putative hydrolase, alpha/beta hydrolase fold family [Mycolicibacterium brisbanense]